MRSTRVRMLSVAWLLAGLASTVQAQGTLHAAAGHASTLAALRNDTFLGTRIITASLDGDALDDRLIEAWDRDSPGRGWGAVHGVLGRATFPASSDLVATPPDFSIVSLLGERVELGATGDLDGDGLEDIVVVAEGAPGPDGLRAGAGAVAIWRGRRPLALSGLIDRRSADVTIHGTVTLVIHDAKTGDVDGDGLDDLLVRVRDTSLARDAVLIHFGGATWPAVIDLATTPGAARVEVQPAIDGPVGDWGAGDITGDGIDDLLLGNGGYWTDSPGTCAIVVGRAAWPALLDANTGDARRSSGRWHALAAGDVTGDGIDDLVVVDSAYRDQEISVFPGSTGGGGGSLRILPMHLDDRPHGVSIADANGDGLLDVLLSANGGGARDLDESTGEIRILLGPLPASGTRDLLTAPPDMTIYGPIDAGVRGVAAGDFDGDRRADIAFGAYWLGCPSPASEACGASLLYLDAMSRLVASAPFTLHVDATLGDDAADGSSWGTALRTIGEALDRASTRRGTATVAVAEGRYAERLLVGSDIVISGGWRPASGTRNPSAAPTIVDGSLAGRVFETRGTERSAPTRLDGLVITRGRAGHGAGVLVNGGGADIVSCELTGNVGFSEWVRRKCKDLATNTFYPYQSENCEAYGTSVAVEEFWSRLRMVNCLVHHDRVERGQPLPGLPYQAWTCQGGPCDDDRFGSAIYVPVVQRAELINNTVADNPGGVWLSQFSSYVTHARHNILAYNGAFDLFRGGGTPSLETNLFTRAPVGAPLSPTNLVADPRFVDRRKYRLSELQAGQAITSPAVDGSLQPATDECLLPAPCLNEYTTRTDGVPDALKLDLGYHVNANEAPLFAGANGALAEGSCAIRVSWTRAVDPERGAVTYEIFRAAAPGAFDLGSPVAVVTDPVTSWLDEGLPYGSTWWWLVLARDVAGVRDGNGIEVTATVSDAEPPEVSALIATVTGCKVTLEWTASDPCSGIARIELHRSPGDPAPPDASTLVAVDPVSPHDDHAAQNGIFSYRIVARDVAGNERIGAPSSAWIGTCAGAMPPPDAAFIPLVSKSPGHFDVVIRPAPGADFHRVLQGSLSALHASGYDHAVAAGLDGVQGTDDDQGSCRTDTTIASLSAGAVPSDAYFLARGVNAAGEGRLGGDSFDVRHPEPTGVACP